MYLAQGKTPPSNEAALEAAGKAGLAALVNEKGIPVLGAEQMSDRRKDQITALGTAAEAATAQADRVRPAPAAAAAATDSAALDEIVVTATNHTPELLRANALMLLGAEASGRLKSVAPGLSGSVTGTLEGRYGGVVQLGALGLDTVEYAASRASGGLLFKDSGTLVVPTYEGLKTTIAAAAVDPLGFTVDAAKGFFAGKQAEVDQLVSGATTASQGYKDNDNNAIYSGTRNAAAIVGPLALDLATAAVTGGTAAAAKTIISAIIPIPLLGKDRGEGGGAPKMEGVDPSNRASFEVYKDELRANMSKPKVLDAKLANIVDKLYRQDASIGSGSTAAAVREELLTSQPTKGRYHSAKATESIAALNSWLKANVTARSSDRAAAENLIRDMQNALKGN
jgi:hypothetical protein